MSDRLGRIARLRRRRAARAARAARRASSPKQITATYIDLSKISYDDMTPEQKWEWAGQFLNGMSPGPRDTEA